MISVSGISKRYGQATALTDVSLQIARGVCVGLTGRNGSGRTTLLRILATLIRPSSGVVTIDGLDAVKDVARIRPRIAYVGEGATLCEPLSSVRTGEYLEFIRCARGTTAKAVSNGPIRDVLARSGLPDATPLGALSAGMRARLALASALSSGAHILLLDEPLLLLDSDGQDRFLDWLRESRDAGTTLVVALNDRAVMTALCQRVAVLEAGRLTAPSQALTQPSVAGGIQVVEAAGLA
jgi:ABC-2 type transport system ATP-binding protein